MDATGDYGANALNQYLSHIETSWNQWIAIVAALGDDQIVASRTCGAWSVKDLIGHVAVWDAVAIEKTQGILSGSDKKPPAESLDEFNDRTWKEFRDRPLPDLQAWMHETHARMIGEIHGAIAASDEQRERIEWATVDDTWKHYDVHREQIAARYGGSV